MNTSSTNHTLVTDELSVLSGLVPLADQHIIELGCGSARLARELLERYPGSQVTGLETDTRQHAKNLAAPQERLTFMLAGAQDIPEADAAFDLALMLKSLHHVPIPLMRQALAEVARVLRNGGHLYVSEPVYAGPLNDIVRVFNDEGPVRLAAQQAVDDAVASPAWVQVAERRFDMPVHFKDFADFERRMMYPTFADHHVDAHITAEVRKRFEPHCTDDGARFTRPMHVRLLQKQPHALRDSEKGVKLTHTRSR